LLFGASFGNPVLGVLGCVVVGVILFLTLHFVRGHGKRRREQRHRQKERREFWGYE
jgi:hypothetical protein